VAAGAAVGGGPAALDGVDKEFPAGKVTTVVGPSGVLEAFAGLAGEQVAFVLSSHDPRVVERSDHLLRLDRGRPAESW
jgi:ABC-type multidrug transport system ATPase subunit